MGKKRKNDSDSDDEDDKKKKKDKKKKNKDGKKDRKKDKSKKKKKSKKESSSSSSGSGSDSSGGKKKDQDSVVPADMVAALEAMSKEKESEALPPPEEGIKRFEFTEKDAGPLGLRFSGGFPPLILAVKPDTPSAKKKVPENYEVHAINGLALVPDNVEKVMAGLKARPVVLDVRPQGWVPSAKRKEREKKKFLEEVEKKARVEEEERRREQVAREAAEEREREAAERAHRKELERVEAEELRKKALEAKAKQRAKNEEFENTLLSEPEPLRKAADMLMAADYGAPVKLEGTGRTRGLPLRLFTRRKEVSWLWAGEVQELIGGGIPDPFSPTE